MTPLPVQAALRFAPSPNGELHLGHALSALTTFEMAKRLQGRFLVRIEDIDVERCRPQYVDACLRDLGWLGLEWEQPVLRQSEHLADYANAAARLAGMGLLYPCFATRAEIQASAVAGAVDPDGAPLYPGLYKGREPAESERRMAAGEPFALRLDMAKALEAARARLGGGALTFTELDDDRRGHRVEAHPERWGDAVIVRKDIPTSYHLSVVVDDARQGITHVTRGRDLYAATDLQRLLQVLLELPEPVYRHHRLITDASGRKLAKSARDTALAQLRQQGWTPRDVRRAVGLGP